MQATSSPLLEVGIEQATGLVWNITGPEDMTLFEVGGQGAGRGAGSVSGGSASGGGERECARWQGGVGSPCMQQAAVG
jgi:hypothetical protein